MTRLITKPVIAVSPQGCHILPQIVPNWHQMGQIWELLRSVSIYFDWVKIGLKCDKPGIFLDQPNCPKLILQSPRFVQFGVNLTLFGANPEIPVRNDVQTFNCSHVSLDIYHEIYFEMHYVDQSSAQYHRIIT